MRFSVRPSPNGGRSPGGTAFHLCSQELPWQTNHPGLDVASMRSMPGRRVRAPFSNESHSLKLSLSESQAPVPTGTTLSSALSRRESSQHQVHRLVRTANTMNEDFGYPRKVIVNRQHLADYGHSPT